MSVTGCNTSPHPWLNALFCTCTHPHMPSPCWCPHASLSTTWPLSVCTCACSHIPVHSHALNYTCPCPCPQLHSPFCTCACLHHAHTLMLHSPQLGSCPSSAVHAHACPCPHPCHICHHLCPFHASAHTLNCSIPTITSSMHLTTCIFISSLSH